MKWTLIILLALATSTVHAHPFDDRAELISSVFITKEGDVESLRLEIQFIYDGPYASMNELMQFVDVNGDDSVSKKEADARLLTLSKDIKAAATLMVDGQLATLIGNPAAFRLADIDNPDADVNNPDGMSTKNLRIGYYFEFNVEFSKRIETGKRRVQFFYASTKASISDPQEQLRVFDDRGERTLGIMDAFYSKTPERFHKVTFSWWVDGPVKPPTEPEPPVKAEPEPKPEPPVKPEKTTKQKQQEAADLINAREQKAEGKAEGLMNKLAQAEPFSWLWFTILGGLFMLGGYHAVQPGHGKTLVASYLIGTQGKPIDALFLGIVVTVAHTSGVFMLMAGAWMANEYWPGVFENPEKQLAEWIALVVGMTIFLMGFALVIKRTSGGHGHAHDVFGRHVDGHDHDHEGEHSHDGHTHTHDHEVDPSKMTRFEILRLGVLGGVIPCPTAFIIGLVAFSNQMYGKGLLAVAVFSIGMGAVLTAIGLMLVHSKEYLQKKSKGSNSRLFKFAEAKLPTFGALVITLIGLTMVVFAAIRLGLLDPTNFTV